MELTEHEKEFLTMLLSIGETVINACDGYFVLNDGDSFDRSDLFYLAKKLNIDDY